MNKPRILVVDDAIPWAGRLAAIVDAFEAMTTTQFYRESLRIAQTAGAPKK